jgi:DNA-binding transcriptional LysR family regulator
VPRQSRISFELLETFVRVIDNEGRASQTAEQLDINPASMSKRLAQLHNVGPLIRRPWLARVGKRWRLTEEGSKLLPAAQDLVRRYDRLRDALEDAAAGPPAVTFACGQQSVTGFVSDAVVELQHRHPDVRLRVATLRGRARVEGVVNGALDLALVNQGREVIDQIAGRSLYVKTIFQDPLVLVAGRGVKAKWLRRFRELPEQGVSAAQAAVLPLIMPEPDADTRRQLDRTFRAAGVRDDLDVPLEIGGWPAVLAYARRGLGAAIVPRSALAASANGFWQRELDSRQFAALTTRLICRHQPAAVEEPDLTPHAALFAELLREAADKAQRSS